MTRLTAGTGRLILSLTKDTYGQLGIVGIPSRFGQKRHRHCEYLIVYSGRHSLKVPGAVIEVDLREDCMRDGKPGYERLKAGLAKFGSMDMMFSFYGPESKTY